MQSRRHHHHHHRDRNRRTRPRVPALPPAPPNPAPAWALPPPPSPVKALAVVPVPPPPPTQVPRSRQRSRHRSRSSRTASCYAGLHVPLQNPGRSATEATCGPGRKPATRKFFKTLSPKEERPYCCKSTDSVHTDDVIRSREVLRSVTRSRSKAELVADLTVGVPKDQQLPPELQDKLTDVDVAAERAEDKFLQDVPKDSWFKTWLAVFAFRVKTEIARILTYLFGKSTNSDAATTAPSAPAATTQEQHQKPGGWFAYGASLVTKVASFAFSAAKAAFWFAGKGLVRLVSVLVNNPRVGMFVSNIALQTYQGYCKSLSVECAASASCRKKNKITQQEVKRQSQAMDKGRKVGEFVSDNMDLMLDVALGALDTYCNGAGFVAKLAVFGVQFREMFSSLLGYLPTIGPIIIMFLTTAWKSVLEMVMTSSKEIMAGMLLARTGKNFLTILLMQCIVQPPPKYFTDDRLMGPDRSACTAFDNDNPLEPPKRDDGMCVASNPAMPYCADDGFCTANADRSPPTPSWMGNIAETVAAAPAAASGVLGGLGKWVGMGGTS